MKKDILKLFTFSLLLILVTTSCSNKVTDEDCEDCSYIYDFIHEETATIIGKWKLEKIRVNSRMGIFCTDCSLYNVVYEFKQDGTLTVSANTENHGWHESGEYSFIKDEWDMGQDGFPWGLSISNGSATWYMLSSKKLIIDYSPMDGATYYFVKN